MRVRIGSKYAKSNHGSGSPECDRALFLLQQKCSIGNPEDTREEKVGRGPKPSFWSDSTLAIPTRWPWSKRAALDRGVRRRRARWRRCRAAVSRNHRASFVREEDQRRPSLDSPSWPCWTV